jgi:hypothetical protein
MDYKSKKVVELKEIAKQRKIKGYYKLLKQELIDLLIKEDEKLKKKSKSRSLSLSSSKTSIISSLKSSETSLIQGYEKLYDKNIFLTSSIAFIYQITKRENKKIFIPKNFTKPKFILTFEEAKECCLNIESPFWEKIKSYLEIYRNDWLKYANTDQIKTLYLSKQIKDDPLDIEFLLEIMRKEALEFQKGNLTLVHSKNIKLLVLDIISQLTSQSYEGFKSKCVRNNNEKRSALEIIIEIFMKENIKQNPNKDHIPELRKRLQSCNPNIFNNAFILGESTIEFYYRGSVLNPQKLLEKLRDDEKLSQPQFNKIMNWMNNISTIGKNCMQIYSIPIDVIQKYVYGSKPYGNIHEQSDIILNYQSYVKMNPWVGLFDFQYQKQMRILDLCFTKYGYNDGIRFYQLTNIPLDKLENLISDISNELKRDKNLNDWFVNYVDIPEQMEQKRELPTKPILSIKSKKFLESWSKSKSKDDHQKEKAKTMDQKKETKEEEIELVVKGDRKGKPEKELVIIPAHKVFYRSKKVVELREIAKSRGLKRYSKLLKEDLIKLLESSERI